MRTAGICQSGPAHYGVAVALCLDFPSHVYAVLDFSTCWFLKNEALRLSSLEKLLPPLMPELHKQIKLMRDKFDLGWFLCSFHQGSNKPIKD
jgi:hypothetical protein